MFCLRYVRTNRWLCTRFSWGGRLAQFGFGFILIWQDYSFQRAVSLCFQSFQPYQVEYLGQHSLPNVRKIHWYTLVRNPRGLTVAVINWKTDRRSGHGRAKPFGWETVRYPVDLRLLEQLLQRPTSGPVFFSVDALEVQHWPAGSCLRRLRDWARVEEIWNSGVEKEAWKTAGRCRSKDCWGVVQEKLGFSWYEFLQYHGILDDLKWYLEDVTHTNMFWIKRTALV